MWYLSPGDGSPAKPRPAQPTVDLAGDVGGFDGAGRPRYHRVGRSLRGGADSRRHGCNHHVTLLQAWGHQGVTMVTIVWYRLVKKIN